MIDRWSGEVLNEAQVNGDNIVSLEWFPTSWTVSIGIGNLYQARLAVENMATVGFCWSMYPMIESLMANLTFHHFSDFRPELVRLRVLLCRLAELPKSDF